jgi:hypothetical protein
VLKNWYDLANSVEVIDEQSGIEVLTLEDILAFERTQGFLLPEEYKEFCQVFGTGSAQEIFNLYSPTDTLIFQQELLQLTVKNIVEFPSSSSQGDRRKIELLQNSFFFGDDSGSCMFMWDLRTYSDVDLSYDIYWGLWDAPSDSFEEEYKCLSRSFFTVVKEFIFLGRVNEFYESDFQTEASEKLLFKRYINQLILS